MRNGKMKAEGNSIPQKGASHMKRSKTKRVGRPVTDETNHCGTGVAAQPIETKKALRVRLKG